MFLEKTVKNRLSTSVKNRLSTKNKLKNRRLLPAAGGSAPGPPRCNYRLLLQLCQVHF